MKKGITVRGFTLIELMIVIAVIGILAAFAFPAYTQFRERGWRAQARAELLATAQMLQRNHSVNNTYAMAVSPGSNITKYTIVLVSADASEFVLSAVLLDDSTCGTLTITETGQRNIVGGTIAECWDR